MGYKRRLIHSFKTIGLAIFLVAGSAGAGSQMEKEISHLLNFISQSNCTFIRNGKDYVPADAVSHIKKKAKYFEDDIKSTEAFIELSASMSTMSKKPYHIKCPKQEKITSQAWLLDELNKFRQKKSM